MVESSDVVNVTKSLTESLNFEEREEIWVHLDVPFSQHVRGFFRFTLFYCHI